MNRIATLCVFCGSRRGTDPFHAEQAIRLGTLLAENGIRLVYGGGGIGLMDILAEATLKAGGRVIGVIPAFLQEREVGKSGLSELIVVDSMHERKRRMFELSDGFVVLPGGLGTLDETLEILTWRQLRLHDKPVVVLDGGGYWAILDRLIDATIEGGFADASARQLYHRAERMEDVLPALIRGAAPGIGPRIDRL